MKKIIYGIPLKSIAIILSLIAALGVALSVLGIIVMFDLEGYTHSFDDTRKKQFRRFAISDAYDIGACVIDGKLHTHVAEDRADTNIRFSVINEAGEVLGNTYSGEAVHESVSEEMQTDRYVTRIDDYGEEYKVSVSGENVTVSVYVLKSLRVKDKYYFANKYIAKLWEFRKVFFWIAGAGLLFCIIVWIYLVCAAGRTAPDGSLKKSPLDAVPFDLLLSGAVMASIGAFYMAGEITGWSGDIAAVLFFAVAGTIVYILAILVLMTFSSRIKHKTLIKNNIIYIVSEAFFRGLVWFCRKVAYVLRTIPFIMRTVLTVLVATVVSFILTLGAGYEMDLHIIFWVIQALILIPAVLYIAVMLSKLKEGGETISSGELSARVDTTHMFGDFKEFGERLNHINDAVRIAVDNSMKSERMKTELITNVSHDIKTPLTSIINYVDLIKKQNIEDAETREYIEVLDRQSRRLKKLVEDLVEASKASTGNLSVELAPCDASVLLSQAVGEFDERLKARELSVVLNIPEKSVNIMADGRRLWRVFDNLLGNICKYAMSGTRVYLDLFESDGEVYTTFRNISEYPLNTSGEELSERFVRGDRSRHTEGSGLGLSIAKSLVELQGGTFDIVTDGDLFKVIIKFGAID